MNSISRAATSDFSFAVADDHDSGISCLVDFNFVIAGTRTEKARFGVSISKISSFSRTAHAHVNGAFR